VNGTILVADDSMVVRAVLRRQLETDGHTVIEAVNGEDAIDACREHHPDAPPDKFIIYSQFTFMLDLIQVTLERCREWRQSR